MQYEQDVPTLVISNNPTSDEGRELISLHATAEELTRILAACRLAHRDAQAAVGVAEAALAAELDRGSQTGEQNTETEIALVRKIEDCKIAANPALHVSRIAAATERQVQAAGAVRTHIDRNIAPLLEELRPEAEKATTALAAARAKMAPSLAAYAAVSAKVNELTSCVHRGRSDASQASAWHPQPPASLTSRERWALPPGDDQVPMPDAATVEEYDRRINPASVPEDEHVVPEDKLAGVAV
jgi:hypothetical protein